MSDRTSLPPDLPAPHDDGAADHLPGARMPGLVLPATDGRQVALADLPSRTVLYLYPRTGEPDVPVPDGWDAIPGARGCTPQACDFRDHHAELGALGATVFGLSSQSTSYQQEVAQRLHLPFALLADPGLELGAALRLPTFAFGGEQLYRRLTLVVAGGAVEHAFYPVFPPDGHAAEVIAWLAAHPSSLA